MNIYQHGKIFTIYSQRKAGHKIVSPNDPVFESVTVIVLKGEIMSVFYAFLFSFSVFLKMSIVNIILELKQNLFYV